MAEKRCVFKCGAWNCGSYQFNLYKDDINQGDLCDVHYWQTKAQLDAIHLWQWTGETHLLIAAHESLRTALEQSEPSKQAIEDVCMIARNAIDRIIELENGK